MGSPGGSDRKEFVGNAGNLGSISVMGSHPGEGNGNSLQDSCLENSMDLGAWQATVHGVAKIRHDGATNTFSGIPIHILFSTTFCSAS